MLPSESRLRAEEHVNELAERYNIRVRRSKEWSTSEAELNSRQIFIPKVFKNGIDYLVALHEIGHIVDPSARDRDRRAAAASGRQVGYQRLMNEAAAWAWAVKQARPSIKAHFTKTDWRRMGSCWAGYAGDVW